MATLNQNYMTLSDLARRTDPNGVAVDIIEMLAQINPIIKSALAVQCNSKTRHLTTIRSGLPSVTWRRLYEGVQPSKSRTTQVWDTTGMLEAWSEVDAKLVELDPQNSKATRLQEATAFLEAMAQEHASTIFYGDTATDPEKFMGLAPRFSSTTAENGNQIVDCGGAGSDNTSIWMIVWSPMTAHLLYPTGSASGVEREDKGKTTKEVSDGSLYDVYREKFCLNAGLSVRDWRYVVRNANIDVSDLSADASTGADLIGNMITGYYRLRQRRVMNGRAAIYCNTTVKEFLHKQALNKASNTLRVKEVDGEEIVSFLGIPIEECDAILNTEAAVA